MTNVLVAIFISTVLYRFPRGTGLFGSSFVGALAWALGTVAAFGYVYSLPLVWIPVIGVYLMVAESFGWSDWWPNNEVDEPDPRKRFIKLSLRGAILLNPLMGAIYFGCYYAMGKKGPWTEVAEVLSGFVTATVLALLLTTFGGLL